MKQTIVVIDGMGGGIGAQLISKIHEKIDKNIEIIALGTNSTATERMVKAGANRGATGENAIKVSVSLGNFILGPIGIVIPNSLMGEITSAMAEAILSARGRRILIPLPHDHFNLVGMPELSLGKLIDKTIDILNDEIKKQ